MPHIEDTLAPVHLRMVVGRENMEAKAGERYLVINPANGKEVGSAPLGRADDAHVAMSAAANALATWRTTRVSERAAAIETAIANVSANLDQLAPLLTREQGKPLAEARVEIEAFVSRMLLFLQLARTTENGRITMVAPTKRSVSPHAPGPQDGVCVSLVSWNFPIGLLAKKIGPVLVAGGTVVVKPAFSTPLTTLRLVQLMVGALPPGVLNCVTGQGDVIGAALTADPFATRIHLTGSNATGEAVRKSPNADKARLVLELAGSDPMIVCADADLSKASQAAVVGRLRNAGQMCVSVKRLYLAAKIYKEFSSRLIEQMHLREPGDGLVPAIAPFIRMGPLHTSELRQRIEAQLADGLNSGGKILLGGRRPAIEHGFFFEPTLIENVVDQSRLVTEELFGPVLPIFEVTGIEEALERANRGAPSLNASIWTADVKEAKRVSNRASCERVWINRLSFRTAENRTDTSDFL